MKLKELTESKKYIYKPGHLQDGKLEFGDGRIVIYKDGIVISKNKANDHNELLRSLAGKFGFDKNEVIGNAIRMYFKSYSDGYIFNGARRIDDDNFEKNKKAYLEMIRERLR
jgi:hypothetical protein